MVFYFGGYYRRVKFKAMAVQVYRFLGRAWSINMLLNRYVVKN